MRKKLVLRWKRRLAVFLAAAMTCNTGMVTSYAEVMESSRQVIQEIEELSEGAGKQSVISGTKEEELNLPTELKVLVKAEEETGVEDGESQEDLLATDSQAEKDSKLSEKTEKEEEFWTLVPVDWVFVSADNGEESYNGDVAGIYTFQAELADSSYDIGDVKMPVMEIEVKELEEGELVGEMFELGTIETIGTDGLSFFSLEDGTVDLTSGNHEKWIDRIQIEDYARELYDTLVEGADNDGIEDLLIDDSYFSETGGFATTISPSSGDKTFSGIKVYEDSDFTSRQPTGAWWDYMKKNFRAAYEAFDRDHPEVFWLNGSSTLYRVYSSNRNGEYKYEVYFLLKTHEGMEDFDVREENYQSESRITAAIEQRDQDIEGILNSITSEYPEDIVAELNDWLTHNNEYNTTKPLDSATKTAWECISALAGSTGTSGPVCEGYARAFKVLCDQKGIPCVLVNGLASSKKGGSGERHMWNYVELDGEWYAVDVTWNDPTGSSGGAISGYENEKWLLIGEDTIVSTDWTFIESHPVTNSASQNGVNFTNGPVLSKTAYLKKTGVEINFVPSSQTLVYTGKEAVITPPSITDGENEIDLTPVYSYRISGSSGEYTDGLPTDAGTYQVKAHTDATDTYKSANGYLTLTIKKSTPSLAFGNDYGVTKVYDGKAFAVPSETQMSVTGAAYGDIIFTWYKDSISQENRIKAAPKDAGTYVLAVAIAETQNTAAVGESVTITISKRNVTVSAHDLSKTYGTEDPDLVYDIGSDTPLPAGESLKGALIREAGENYREEGYVISQGTLTDGNNPNYSIDFKQGIFLIRKAPYTVEVKTEQSVARSTGVFRVPVFRGVKNEEVSGNLTYTYDGKSMTYDQVTAALREIPAGSVITVGYSFETTDSNYNGDKKTGDIRITVEDLEFFVGSEPASVNQAVTVKDNPVYGDSWEEIITINPDLIARIGQEQDADPRYELNVTGKPGVGEHSFQVLYSGTINGSSFENIMVCEGIVTVGKAGRSVVAPTAETITETSIALKKADETSVTGFGDGTVEYGYAQTNDSSKVIQWKTVDDKEDVVTFSGLNHGTAYYFFIRIGEGVNYLAGVSEGVVLTTEKTKLNKPVLSDNGSYPYTGELQEVKISGYDGETMTISGNTGINAGNYTAIISLLDPQHYAWTDGSSETISLNWTITKLSQEDVSIQAIPTKTYGDDTFVLEASGGSGTGAITFTVPENNGVLSISGNQAVIVGAGTVQVTAVKAEDENYENSREVSAEVTVAKKPVTVKAADKERAFGEENPELTLEVEEGTLVGNDSIDALGVTLATDAIKNSKEGSYTITGTVSGETNYEVTVLPGTLTVIRGEQKIGLEKPVLSDSSYVYTGEVQEVKITGYDEETMTISGNTGTNAGNYTAIISLLDPEHYTWADGSSENVSLNWMIEKSSQEAVSILSVPTKTYGDDAFALEASGGSGTGAMVFAVPENNGVLAVSGNQAVIVGAGTVRVSAVRAGDENYADSSEASVEVTVAKKPVTVKAEDKRKFLGQENPELTLEAPGEGILVGNDGINALGVTLSTNAEKDSDVGSYPITGTASQETNYEVTVVPGTLTIAYKTQYKTENQRGITQVPEGLKDHEDLNTPEKIENKMKDSVRKAMDRVANGNIVVYNVTLMLSVNNGQDWIPATEDDFPEEGITVTLPYPGGSRKTGYEYIITHMFTTGEHAGEIEIIHPETTEDGLRFTVYSLSPFAIGYKSTRSTSSSSGSSGSSGGSGSKTTTTTSLTPTVSGSWSQDIRGWRFLNTNGTYESGTTAVNALGNTQEYISWKLIRQVWWAFGADGYAKDGWVLDAKSNLWYYIDINTGMRTGWFLDSQTGHWYYLDPVNGHMLAGWQFIDGVWYYLNGTLENKPFGAMYSNEKTPDGYFVEADGRWLGR